MRAKKLALCAVLAAMLMAGQVALSFLPNIEPCTLLLILYTLAFSPSVALWSALVFVLLQGLLYDSIKANKEKMGASFCISYNFFSDAFYEWRNKFTCIY